MKSNTQLRNGLLWNALNLIVNKGVSIIVRLLIARIIAPQDFGLVAFLMIFTGILTLASDFGLKNYIIQKNSSEYKISSLHSIFWLLSAFGIFWYAVYVFIISPSLYVLYDDIKIYQSSYIMGLSILISSLTVVPESTLIRRLKFKSVVLSEIVAVTASSLLAIALAFWGAAFWALAWQNVANAFIRSCLIWRASRWRPRLVFSRNELKLALSKSVWMSGAQFIHFARTNMDNVVIGIMLGPHPLGIYSIAYTLSETLRSQVASVISRVMLPIYSRMQDNPREVAAHYLTSTKFMCLILFPFLFPLIAYSEEFVALILGEEWRDASVPLSFLSICGVFYATSGPSAEVLQAIGRSDALFKVSLNNMVLVGAPSMLIFTYAWGINGSAGAMLLSYVTIRMRTYLIVKEILKISLSDILFSVFPAITLTVVTWVILDMLELHWILISVAVAGASLAAIVILVKGMGR